MAPDHLLHPCCEFETGKINISIAAQEHRRRYFVTAIITTSNSRLFAKNLQTAFQAKITTMLHDRNEIQLATRSDRYAAAQFSRYGALHLALFVFVAS